MSGGVGFLELKVSETDNLWHVHLHILLEGRFWDVKEISREWHAVTGDSCIVHIGKSGSIESMSHYATKYVTKPADASVFAQQAKLDELIISLRGRRLATPFGSWKSMKLTELPESDREWLSVGSIDSLKQRAAQHDLEAIKWLQAAARKWPLLINTFLQEDDTS